MFKLIQPRSAILLVTFLLISILLTIRYDRFAAKRHYGDFHVYYVTGQRVLTQLPIYVDETETVTPYKYSPLVASFFSLLAAMNEKIAAGIWHLLNLFFLIASAVIGADLAQKDFKIIEPRLIFWISVLGIAGVSPALIHCLNSGQVGIAILFCYVLGVYFASKDQSAAAGFFLALSCMFKYLPILILPYFLFQKKWKLLLSMMAWLIALHLMPAFWFGWSRNAEYLSQFLPFLTGTTLDHISLLDFKNQSMWAYLYRLIFYDFGFFEVRQNAWVVLALGAGLFAALYWLLVSRTRHGLFVLGCALLSVLIVIFNPNAWKHNFVLLLLPYQILLSQAFLLGWRSWQAKSLLIASALLFISNRSVVGWGGRFELMSLSVLLLAALTLFSALILSREPEKFSALTTPNPN